MNTSVKIDQNRFVHARGSVMILVLLSVVIATVIGVTFMVSSTTLTKISETMSDHAQARLIAESGIALATRYIEQTPDWHTKRTSGTWIAGFEIYGGTCSVEGEFDAAAVSTSIPMDDWSFEQSVGQLANPLFSPPMSGTIGGWNLQRTSLLLLGTSVPHIGISISPFATDDGNIGFVRFPLSIVGTATFSQTLAEALQPEQTYLLKVDVGKAGLALLLADIDIRVYAGAMLVASSSDPTLLSVLDLSNDMKQYALRFTTDNTPPAGNIRIELHAESLVGVLSAAAFDNLQMIKQSTDPLVLTATANYANAYHRVSVYIFPSAGVGKALMVEWDES